MQKNVGFKIKVFYGIGPWYFWEPKKVLREPKALHKKKALREKKALRDKDSQGGVI